MEISDYIENGKKIIDAFGYWPTFHDGEIHQFNLGTFYKEDEGYNSSYLEFVIHCWHMTDKIENGYFVLENQNLVTFRFEDINDLDVDGFGHQNAVLSIDFTVLPPNERGFTPVLVEIDPANGIGGEFKAFSAKIISIEKYQRNGSKS